MSEAPDVCEQVPLPPETRECWRCGKQVAADAARCPFCAAPPRTAARAGVGAAPPAPKEDRGLLRVLGVFALLLAVSVATSAVVRIEQATAKEVKAPDAERIVGLIATLEIIDTAIVIAALFWIRPRPSVRPPLGQRLSAWPVFLLVLALLLTLNMLYHQLLRGVAPIDPIDWRQFAGPRLLPLWIVLVCVQPAVFEELFFRYLALGTLQSVTGTHAAVVASSIMFGMAHLGTPLSIPLLTLLGLGLGYARVASGGMALPILMHFAHNAVIVALQVNGLIE